MSHSKIEKTDVDIYKCPTPQVTAATQLSIGDLHANAMFMMHFLVSNGVVKISDKNYARLKEIYVKSALTRSDIDEFNKIIDQLEIGEKPLIRLIGDEICDRGQNDYFIFKILNKLKHSDVKTEILLSNHGIEFLIPYENKRELYAPNIGFMGQSRSMDNMRQLLEKGVITKEEVDDLVKDIYLPSLKLISYSLHDNNITIYSHAGIGLETIKALATKFKDQGVVFKDDTAEDLAQTIEDINLVFAQHVKAGTVNTLVKDIKNPNDSKNDPVTFLIWNRSYWGLEREKEHKGYQLNFAHGHDSGEPTKDNIFNLDNTSFKGDSNQGKYTILGSQGGPVAELKVHISVIQPKPEEPVSLPPKDTSEEVTTKPKVSREGGDLVSPFHSELAKLWSKAQQLQQDGHIDAYNSAMTIYNTCNQAFQTLQKDKDHEKFNTTCTEVIAKERPVLDKHRGWSEFLTNLLLTIPAGIGLLIKGIVNITQNRSFFFVHKTESAKIVDEIQDKLDQSPKQ